jgi:hypothetical protein
MHCAAHAQEVLDVGVISLVLVFIYVSSAAELASPLLAASHCASPLLSHPASD